MEGKRSVSIRGTQVGMEAFVAWVQHRLNELLGIPQEDERGKVVEDVKLGLNCWIRDAINAGVLESEDTEVSLRLAPWIEHQLIDLLWLQQKDEGKTVADVKFKFYEEFRPSKTIENQLLDLVTKVRNVFMEDLSGELKKEDEALKKVMDPMSVSIKHQLDDVLSAGQGGAKGMLVSVIKNHLNDVFPGKEEHGVPVSGIKRHLNDVFSGKGGQGGEKGMLVSLIKHHLKDVSSGKEEEQGNEKAMLVFAIKQHMNDVLSRKEEQSGLLVSLIKHELSVFLGNEQQKGDDEQKMERAVLARLEGILSSSVQQKLSDQIKIERPETVHDIKIKLEDILGTAKAVLQEPAGESDGDQKRKAAKQEAQVWEWVDNFVGASYETLAQLEERKQIDMKKQVSSSLTGKRDRYDSKLYRNLKTCLDSLKKLSDKGRELSCTYHESNDEFGSLVTSSKIDEYEVYGRKRDKKSILKHLLPRIGEKKVVKVVSIVGNGGSGKTILAQIVFNDQKVEKHFQLRAWVSVSNFFDEKELARGLLHSIGRNDDELDPFQLLEECFSGNVFLCVFDDVWIEDPSMWIRFAFLLKIGAPGSRILVTTRSRKTAQVVASDRVHRLKPLSNTDWWLVWKYGLVLSDLNKISKPMEEIGSKLANMCHGLPLAAFALGQILLNKDTANEWESELIKVSDMGAEIWRIKDVASEVFRHFHRSYQQLSPPLKLCILYCANFDKGTAMIVDQVIRMWMSQGYLDCSFEDQDEDEAKTKKGLEYFDYLASHSFFQELVKGSIHKNNITSFKLNDTFHDFIRYKARHDLTKALDHQEKIRERHFHIAFHGRIPENFNCRRWKDVRSLVLSSSQLQEVPNEVGELNHVRYLDLSNNPLKELPEAVCKLECLEYLDVHRCSFLLSLPRSLQKFKQLKHLRVGYTTDELHKRLPKGFEELTLIRTLDLFRTGGSGYKDAMVKLKEFTKLTDICFSVHGEVNFLDADFGTKFHLKNMELCFVEEGLDQEKASKIMENFKPPPNLVMLMFGNYPLMELPKSIIEEPFRLKTLTRLSFRSAFNITSFPALWKLPSLEFLWLYNIPKLKQIGREFFGLPGTLQLKTSDFPNDVSEEEEEDEDNDEEEEEDINYIMDDGDTIKQYDVDKTMESYPKLKTLRIECMKNLKEWQDMSEDEKKESLVIVMPSLEELSTPGCPKLVEKPLCILRDTPWFKRTKQTNPKKDSCSLAEEEEEKNLPSPSQKESSSLPEDKEEVIGTGIPIDQLIDPPVVKYRQVESNGLPDEDYAHTKLRKFVHDTYVSKGSMDHFSDFKVVIPKGVLGNKEVTACLLLKDLYEWFQPHGWVFAEQLCIWSKLIYEELMTPTDRERVQMVSSALITSVGRNYEKHPDTRAVDLVNFMMQNQARLYLVPYLRPGHWELLAIVPENGVVYRFDSLQGNLNPELTDLMKMVEEMYPNKVIDSWRIIDIKHKRQTGTWECGYYVMIWMHKIATTNIQSLDLKQHFPLDELPYNSDEFTKLAQQWCLYVLPELPV